MSAENLRRACRARELADAAESEEDRARLSAIADTVAKEYAKEAGLPFAVGQARIKLEIERQHQIESRHSR